MKRSIRKLAIPLLIASTSGCAMPGHWEMPTVRNPFKKAATDSAYAKASEELKNPEKTFLSYAQWKENVGQVAEARKTYDDILENEPQNVRALIGRARLDQKSGLAEQAEQTLLTAIKKNPENTDLLHALGDFYAKEERFAEAIAPLQQAVEASPYHTGYRFDLAVAQVEADRVDDAITNFAVCVGKAEAYYNAGYVIQQNGDIAQAESLYRQALALKPKLTQAHTMLAAIDKQRRSEIQLAEMAIQPAPATNIQQVADLVDDADAAAQSASSAVEASVDELADKMVGAAKEVTEAVDASGPALELKTIANDLTAAADEIVDANQPVLTAPAMDLEAPTPAPLVRPSEVKLPEVTLASDAENIDGVLDAAMADIVTPLSETGSQSAAAQAANDIAQAEQSGRDAIEKLIEAPKASAKSLVDASKESLEKVASLSEAVEAKAVVADMQEAAGAGVTATTEAIADTTASVKASVNATVAQTADIIESKGVAVKEAVAGTSIPLNTATAKKLISDAKDSVRETTEKAVEILPAPKQAPKFIHASEPESLSKLTKPEK